MYTETEIYTIWIHLYSR